MKVLFCGDVVGRAGREAIEEHIPRLRKDLKLDLVIVNGENAAAGFGVTEKICKSFYACGVDVITTGNHVWDQKELLGYINKDPRILRPHNYPPGTPGSGVYAVPLGSGRQFIVMHVMLQLFMPTLNNPFLCLDELLKRYVLTSPKIAGIFVDIHGEATSEKVAMGHYLDGRVSAVVGTHTHVPTADEHILPGGTAYQTDAGMCGCYDSVVGMDKEVPIDRFTRNYSLERLKPAQGPGTLCGTLITISDHTGLATEVSSIRIGPHLKPTKHT